MRLRSVASFVLSAAGLVAAISGCSDSKERSAVAMTEKPAPTPTPSGDRPALPKTDADWRKLLTPEQYNVCRQKGTERPFQNAYWNNKKDGLYRCAACGEELFAS